MAEIRKLPLLRHLRGDPNAHILRYRRGRLVASGRGLSFWFQPLSASIVSIPVDDRELPFLFHGRSKDFQDVTVQGSIGFHVVEPEKLAARVDFSLDLDTGALTERPLEKLSAMVTELAQQSTWDYLAATSLIDILEHGFEPVRERICEVLLDNEALESIGIEVTGIRLAAIKPEASVEKALQTPARERIQQQADEATFARRALAVEKERAISENELQSRIELAAREQKLIEREGENGRRRAQESAEALRIEAEGEAQQDAIKSEARAKIITQIETAKNEAEAARMAIYRDFPTHSLLGLAAQQLAGKLERIDHLSLSPDALTGMLSRLAQAGSERLEQSVVPGATEGR